MGHGPRHRSPAPLRVSSPVHAYEGRTGPATPARRARGVRTLQRRRVSAHAAHRRHLTLPRSARGSTAPRERDLRTSLRSCVTAGIPPSAGGKTGRVGGGSIQRKRYHLAGIPAPGPWRVGLERISFANDALVFSPSGISHASRSSVFTSTAAPTRSYALWGLRSTSRVCAARPPPVHRWRRDAQCEFVVWGRRDTSGAASRYEFRIIRCRSVTN
ncbi:hypothetical protein B0H12DRAFT_1147596 [Mycena haematopus]|nr:hypothetical protein B0H12DRAFT_1147596 [Mycena haematopus]